jgi:hypothetical protein
MSRKYTYLKKIIHLFAKEYDYKNVKVPIFFFLS